MELKVAEYSDYEAIAQLHIRSWQTYYQGILDSQYLEDEIQNERRAIWQTRLIHPPFNQHIIIAKDQERLCGFICVFGHHDFVLGSMIDALHVDPNYQHRGIATSLLLGASQWLAQYFGDTGIYLEVLTKNHQAVAFYEHMQGERAKQRKWVAPCGTEVDEVIYTWPSPQCLTDQLAAHRGGVLQTS